MISELRLRNFQSFADEVTVPLAPLTFIFGPNSSGKSSPIRSLLFRKHSSTSVSRFDDRVSFVGNDVDLGGFANVVHRHDTKTDFRIGVTFAPPDGNANSAFRVAFTVRDGDFPREITVGGSLVNRVSGASGLNRGTFSLTFREDPDDLNCMELDGSASRGFDAIAEALSDYIESRSQDVSPQVVSGAHVKDVLTRIKYYRRDLYVSGRGARPTSLGRGPDHIADPDAAEDQSTYWLRRFIDEVINQQVRRIDASLRNVTHMAGLRVIPDRFSNMGGSTRSMTSDASNIVNILGTDNKIARNASKALSDLTNGAYELQVARLSGDIDFLGDVGSLVLRDTRLNTMTTFKDVGVGLSQVLPIIVALAKGRQARVTGDSAIAMRAAGSTPLLEQPELHLHPRMQSNLTDLLIDQALSKQSRGTQVILETHSENMILRLQRRMREGSVTPDDVAVLYVDRDESSGVSSVKHLPLEENGEFLTAWPEEFSVIRLDEMLP
jgi:hypothetical protein